MRRWTLALLAAALAVAVGGCADGSGSARPPHDASTVRTEAALATSEASPWIAVAYGQAELSIPPDWYVLYQQPPCVVGGAPGELFADPLAGVFHCPAVTGRIPSSVVTLESLDPTVKASTTFLVIHGITVWKATAAFPGTYLVPALHIQIRVDGPLGSRVLHTLEPSPRHLVLRHGQVSPVPAGWLHVSFAGLRVPFPASWPVSRTDIYGSDCSPLQTVELFPPPGAVLDTDTRLLLPPCPYEPPAQPPQQAAQGLRIDERAIYPEVPPSAFGHCLHIHELRVCPASTPAFSILLLRVSVPGRAHPVYVSIGLAGGGRMARSILYSLQAS